MKQCLKYLNWHLAGRVSVSDCQQQVVSNLAAAAAAAAAVATSSQQHVRDWLLELVAD